MVRGDPVGLTIAPGAKTQIAGETGGPGQKSPQGGKDQIDLIGRAGLVPRGNADPAHADSANPTASHDQVIEPRIRRRLSRGQLPIDATIDLHGLRQHEAHAALCRFVAARHARGDRTLLVITGKGLKKTGYGAIEQRGVLRTMLPVWLNEPALKPYVSGYEVSARGHGGEGAYYVRLKRGGK